ncbi:MAG TPA: peptidoglycan editing factor PgeF [Methylomirabilota bacterium]|nr:peptidoglycan editing factor PgeF [Methylomirabilota bacterium]
MTPASPRWVGDPPLYLTSPLLSEAGLHHLFTTRHFPGVTPPADPSSPFGPEALALLGPCGLALEPVAFLRQVHGANVILARRGGLRGKGDVLATDRPGLPLAVFTADCLPLLIHDPAGGRLAVAHAGWRGTAEAVTRAAADALVTAGGHPEDFVAAIGPSIGPCCYEVDAPVIERLERAFGSAWQAWVTRNGPGRWMLDLWTANEAALVRAGLRAERIDNPRLCTSCRQDLFFSYRRGRGEGRLVAVAALPAGRAAAC